MEQRLLKIEKTLRIHGMVNKLYMPLFVVSVVLVCWISTNSFTKSYDSMPPYINTVTTNSSGQAVFYLTKTGTGGSEKTLAGDIIYTNVRIVSPKINDASNDYAVGWTVSSDKKTLTVQVNKITSVLGVLTFTASASGIPVDVIVLGN